MLFLLGGTVTCGPDANKPLPTNIPTPGNPQNTPVLSSTGITIDTRVSTETTSLPWWKREDNYDTTRSQKIRPGKTTHNQGSFSLSRNLSYPLRKKIVEVVCSTISPISRLDTVLNPLNAEAQGRKDFVKPSKPCHVGIHWIAIAEYPQMSTLFQVFCIILYQPN